MVDVLGFGKGVATGAWGGVVGAAEGVAGLAIGGWNILTDSAAREKAWNTTVDLAESAADYAGSAARDPSKPFKDIGNAASSVYEQGKAAHAKAVAEGREAEFWGEAAGKAVFEIGTTVVPVGAAAKLGKLGKVAETAGDVGKIVDKVDDALDTARVIEKVETAAKVADDLPDTPTGVVQDCPKDKKNGVLSSTEIDGLPKTVPTDKSFIGYLYGNPIEMPDVPIEKFDYIKRADLERDALRNKFDSSVRANFVKSLTKNETDITRLRAAGLDDMDILKLSKGKIPYGWQVHHIFPLDDNGTNAFSNLSLIKNNPWHKLINNEQTIVTKGMKAGDIRNVEWPVIKENIYNLDK